MSNLNVRDMVEWYLKRHGYDGLVAPYGDCSCQLKDLMPCVDYSSDCKPGYSVPCDPNTCQLGGCGHPHITTEPPMRKEDKE